MTTRRYPIEHFDGAVLDDQAAARHLDFARRQDALVRPMGDRSYVIPDRCDWCALVVESFERQFAGNRTDVRVEFGADNRRPGGAGTPRATAHPEVAE